MKIKCCGQLKNPKVEKIMASGDVKTYRNARNRAVALYDIMKESTDLMSEEQLGTLLGILASITFLTQTEKDRIIGTRTCCTSTINKPLAINVPGIGNCSYTGD